METTLGLRTWRLQVWFPCLPAASGLSSPPFNRPSMEGGSSGEALDADDQDDSSSSFPTPQDSNSLLDSFRNEWKREIEESPANMENVKNVPKEKENTITSVEDEAKALFQKGVENEEKGKLYEAIMFYRKAVQLVPDIELKMRQLNVNSSDVMSSEDVDVEGEGEEEGEEESREAVDEEWPPFDPATTSLLAHLAQRMARHKTPLCTPAQPPTGTHLSSIPMEVFLYILKWVVSADLDMTSLERCSLVCRGFYLCCRDSEIWKIACKRVWGLKCGNLVTADYVNWREMFILRPRLQYSGCYISKTSYIRPGENSFQDQSYRPWHLVTYFRYLRFFPDSTALMLTTPNEPVLSVGLLKGRVPPFSHSPIFKGHYRLHDNMVSLFVSPQPDKRGKLNANQSLTFHLVLEIANTKRHLHGKLVWKHYSVITTRNGTVNDSLFELKSGAYPPFWFSLVKSYATQASDPLV